jgi:hypothetical protein
MPQCKFTQGNVRCNKQDTDGKKGLCKQHFTDLWWTWREDPGGRAKFGDQNDIPGMMAPFARRDLRSLNAAKWTLTLAADVKDRYFEFRSAPFVVEKGLRKLANKVVTVSNSQTDFYFGRPNANGDQGHSYFRLKSSGVDECFGFTTGASGEDAHGTPQHIAGSNQLCIDYALTLDQKNAVCDMISEWIFYSYDLNARNCTEFAKAACDAAGIWWPAFGLPAISNQTGSFGRVQTPNNLYLALQLSQSSYNPKFEGEHTHAPQGFMGLYLSEETQEDMKLALAAVVIKYGLDYML